MNIFLDKDLCDSILHDIDVAYSEGMGSTDDKFFSFIWKIGRAYPELKNKYSWMCWGEYEAAYLKMSGEGRR